MKELLNNDEFLLTKDISCTVGRFNNRKKFGEKKKISIACNSSAKRLNCTILFVDAACKTLSSFLPEYRLLLSA